MFCVEPYWSTNVGTTVLPMEPLRTTILPRTTPRFSALQVYHVATHYRQVHQPLPSRQKSVPCVGFTERGREALKCGAISSSLSCQGPFYKYRENGSLI